MSQNIEQYVIKSNECLALYSKLIDGLTSDAHSKNVISISLACLSIEHNRSINLLVQNHNYGSAFALVRPQFEACVRSVWFYHCAGSVEIESYLKGGEPPKVHLMINSIEKIDGYTEKQLSAIKAKVGKSLNGFTHGGDFHVKSRVIGKEIISNYDNKQIIE